MCGVGKQNGGNIDPAMALKTCGHQKVLCAGLSVKIKLFTDVSTNIKKVKTAEVKG